MDKYEDDYHNCTSERIAQLLCEMARLHVGNEREIILEAAKRLEARKYENFMKGGEQ